MDAQRLKAAWERFQDENKGVSQAWLAAETRLGNQSLIGQYLNGGIPLNVKALLAICKVIRINPAEISPTLSQNIPASIAAKPQPVFDPALAAEIGEVVLRYSLATPEDREYVLGILRDSGRLAINHATGNGD
jgi:hypothetical protein